FEAVAALQPGEAFVLANDHDPKPLRFQLEAREPGQIDWLYLAEGPELWRVQVGRVAGHCCWHIARRLARIGGFASPSDADPPICLCGRWCRGGRGRCRDAAVPVP